MAEPLVIFQAINSLSAQQFLLQKVLSERVTLFLKDSSGSELELKPMSLNSNLQLKCQNSYLSADNAFSEKQLLSFSLGSEKYICDTSIRRQNDLIIISVLNLFHLQRRRHFRYTIPRSFPIDFRATLENFKTFSARIIDINTEGCALEADQESLDLSLDDHLHGEIKVPGKAGITLQGQIKNLRPGGPTLLIIGVEFRSVNSHTEEQIVRLISEIQRDSFFKKSA